MRTQPLFRVPDWLYTVIYSGTGLHGRLTGFMSLSNHVLLNLGPVLLNYVPVLLNLGPVLLNYGPQIDLRFDLRLTSHMPHYLAGPQTPFQS